MKESMWGITCERENTQESMRKMAYEISERSCAKDNVRNLRTAVCNCEAAIERPRTTMEQPKSSYSATIEQL